MNQMMETCPEYIGDLIKESVHIACIVKSLHILSDDTISDVMALWSVYFI